MKKVVCSSTGHCCGQYIFGHYLAAVEASELLKSSAYSESLLVSIEKTKYSVLVLGFSVGDFEFGGVFAVVAWPCAPIQRAIFWVKFSFWNLG